MKAIVTIALSAMLAVTASQGIAADKKKLAFVVNAASDFWKLAEAGVKKAQRELLFVEAARALGVRTSRILWRHILPNLMSPILVQVSFIFAYAILAEAALSFLGVGVPPEIPTWGTMVAGSQQYAHQAFWIVLFPGLAIVFTALSLQLFGDGVRDLLDPKLKQTP